MLNVYIKEKDVFKKKLLFSTLKDQKRIKQIIRNNYPDSKIEINQTEIIIYEKQKPHKKFEPYEFGK